jgi:hypothetical protein
MLQLGMDLRRHVKEGCVKIRLALVLALSVSVLALASSSTDQLHIKFERQHAFQNGRQKFVVTVTNTAKELFRGKVHITAIDKTGKMVDSDTIFLDDGLPPDGAQKFAILWLREPAQIASLKYDVSGSFQAVPAQRIDVQYEEVGRRPGLNYMSVFIYTAAKDRESLQKIVGVYKARYSSLNGFQIFFLSDRKKAARDLPMSDAALSCLFAQYWRNKSNGKESLDFN